MDVVVPLPEPPAEPAPRGFFTRLLLLLGPPAAIFGAWWALDRFVGEQTARECLVAGGLFLTFVGPTVILGPAVVGTSGFEHLSTWSLVGVAAFMTVTTAFFWTYNLDLLERVPRVGPVLRRARARMTARMVGRRWLRRVATVGVGLFVLMPLPGSGTFGGALMGRVLGLTRRACFLSVSLGGTAITLAYGWFGDEIQRLSERYELGTPARVGVALALVVVFWIVGKAIARLGAAEPAATPAPDAEG